MLVGGEAYVTRNRLLFALRSTSAKPSTSMTGGTGRHEL
jgi:hypothetical protein